MDKATYKKLILNVLYGKHKNFPDDKLDECIKEFDTNIRELEEELACKKQTLIDLSAERARRCINKKFGLKIGEATNVTKEIQKHCKSCAYYDKLLNVCFLNNPYWKEVWDEAEACEHWQELPD